MWSCDTVLFLTYAVVQLPGKRFWWQSRRLLVEERGFNRVLLNLTWKNHRFLSRQNQGRLQGGVLRTNTAFHGGPEFNRSCRKCIKINVVLINSWECYDML